MIKIDINLIYNNYKEKLFDLFISNKKYIFRNSYEEHLNDMDKSLLQIHHVEKSTVENVNTNPLKLMYIMKLNRALEIKKSF